VSDVRFQATSDQQMMLVEEVLERFFSLSTQRAASLAPSYEALWKTLKANTSGGKRFRPHMVMTAYGALGGQDFGAAAHVGASFELLHTALIVHDDVIDRDFVRRGIPNVSGSYRDIAQTAGISLPTAEHRGMSVAVIAGDLALTGAFRLIERAHTTPQIREKLVELLDKAVFDSAAGELIDVDFSLHASMPSVEDIVHMERLKTAVYTFEAPLQAGALLAGAGQEVLDALGEFGRNIGIAYQIVDDLLGVFGDEQVTGKSALGDLREGKRTALISFASQTPQWSQIAELIGNSDLSDAEAALVREVLENSDAKAFTQRLAADYADHAIAALNGSVIPEVLRNELTPLVKSVVERVR
jgi:geranylgeranyl diphosphate synthase type II